MSSADIRAIADRTFTGTIYSKELALYACQILCCTYYLKFPEYLKSDNDIIYAMITPSHPLDIELLEILKFFKYDDIHVLTYFSTMLYIQYWNRNNKLLMKDVNEQYHTPATDKIRDYIYDRLPNHLQKEVCWIELAYNIKPFIEKPSDDWFYNYDKVGIAKTFNILYTFQYPLKIKPCAYNVFIKIE